MESEERYRQFQAVQARLLIGYLARQGVELSGRTLLDLGSGFGGYSREFARRGARVLSLDVSWPCVADEGIEPLRASAAAIPLCEGSVDLVFCASLIEHVPWPASLLGEIERVLKVGGIAYVSFPPYYSPLGGHEYAPFHYLGERVAMRLRRRRSLPEWVREHHPVRDDAAGFADLFDGYGLFKMTIAKFDRLLRASGLRRLDKSTRFLPVSFIKWPVIGELLTWHAQFLLLKMPAGAPPGDVPAQSTRPASESKKLN